jgi:hypothetical protein
LRFHSLIKLISLQKKAMMKFSNTLMLTLVVMLFWACSGSDNSANSNVTNANNAAQQPVQQPTVIPPGEATVTTTVQHYICPNNCQGSGGPAAGNCPVCGTEYIHNQAYHNQQQPQVQPQTTQPTNTAAASGVQHYICPNNCEGSGGAAAGNCPVCGTAYIHNQAYHTQGAAAPNAATSINPTISTMKGPQAQPGTQSPSTQTITPQMPKAPAPAKNAAGVYHYACTKSGCDGGAGSAGRCPKCGSALAHNQAYHQ